MEKKKTVTSIPTNYAKEIAWVKSNYEDGGIAFPHAFEKDMIQNAVGARGTDTWNKWSVHIDTVTNETGTYVVVEDCGTTGLIGNLVDVDDINNEMNTHGQLGAEEKYGRFISMFNSGGNQQGGGLYGVGKSLCAAASEDMNYYFDSLRIDGKYIANMNSKGQVYKVPFAEKEAKDWITKETGMSPKTTTGTRIIIVNPVKELVRDIADGTIEKYIQFDWTKAINNLPKRVTVGFFVNGHKVVGAEEDGVIYSYRSKKPELYKEGFRVKNYEIGICEEGTKVWNGISYYRKGMRIGYIDLKNIPDELDGKIFGHIEVDDQWETALAEIEDAIHFGVSAGKKTKVAYQNLKNFVNEKLEEKLVEWGYLHDSTLYDNKLQNAFDSIAAELQNSLLDQGITSLDMRRRVGHFDIRLQNVEYPNPDTETVTTGDIIACTLRMTNLFKSDKMFEYIVYVTDTKQTYPVARGPVMIKKGKTECVDIRYEVSPKTATQFAGNKIFLVVKELDSGTQLSRSLNFYYDTAKTEYADSVVELKMHARILPTPQSRRVNTGEAIKNVSYYIRNNTNETLPYILEVNIKTPEDTEKDMDGTPIHVFTGVLEPFEEIVTEEIPAIVFDDTMSHGMEKCFMTLNAEFFSPAEFRTFEAMEIITTYNMKLYYNCDEPKANNSPYSTVIANDPSDCRRSWYQTGTNRHIVINVGHKAYQSVLKSKKLWDAYVKEQICKQITLMYIAEGRYDMLGKTEAELAEMSPTDVAELVMTRIENILYGKTKTA